MKSLIFLAAILFPLVAFSQPDHEKAEFKVHGNCGNCKATIENAVNVDGVSEAEWSVETKMLAFNYDPELVRLDDIYEKIAAVGYAFEMPEGNPSGGVANNPAQQECGNKEVKEACGSKADDGGGC